MKFLEACNLVFERGILSKGGWIKNYPNPITNSIKEGFKFFVDWYDKLLEQGILGIHVLLTTKHTHMYYITTVLPDYYILDAP